jgi:hypothetical protein
MITNFFEGRDWTLKEYTITLAVVENLQGNTYFLSAKPNCHVILIIDFLEC